MSAFPGFLTPFEVNGRYQQVFLLGIDCCFTFVAQKIDVGQQNGVKNVSKAREGGDWLVESVAGGRGRERARARDT